jgi:hypothetical protein
MKIKNDISPISTKVIYNRNIDWLSRENNFNDKVKIQKLKVLRKSALHTKLGLKALISKNYYSNINKKWNWK